MQPILTVDTLTIHEALANGKYRITGEAIHPCKTHHEREWATLRYYVEPYLESAASSMIGKPLVIDHGEGHYGQKLSSENKVISAFWDPIKSAVCFEAQITPDVYQLFVEGMLKHKVSVGVNWQKPGGGVIVDGQGEFIPYGFDFSELSLISKASEPGDPLTNLTIWESILREAAARDKNFDPNVELPQDDDDLFQQAIERKIREARRRKALPLGMMPQPDYSNCKHLGEQ